MAHPLHTNMTTVFPDFHGKASLKWPSEEAYVETRTRTGLGLGCFFIYILYEICFIFYMQGWKNIYYFIILHKAHKRLL